MPDPIGDKHDPLTYSEHVPQVLKFVKCRTEQEDKVETIFFHRTVINA